MTTLTRHFECKEVEWYKHVESDLKYNFKELHVEFSVNGPNQITVYSVQLIKEDITFFYGFHVTSIQELFWYMKGVINTARGLGVNL